MRLPEDDSALRFNKEEQHGGETDRERIIREREDEENEEEDKA